MARSVLQRAEATLSRSVRALAAAAGTPDVAGGVPDAQDKRDSHLRLLMSLLALIYPSDDVFRAYSGMTSGEKDVASNAVELLDNLLQADHKRSLLPFIEACVR